MPDLASASLTAACAGSAAASNAATMMQVCKRLDLCGGVRMRFMAKPPNTPDCRSIRRNYRGYPVVGNLATIAAVFLRQRAGRRVALKNRQSPGVVTFLR